MPRLRDPSTGVIVNVSEELAATLSGYEPAAKPRSSTAKSGATPKKASEPSGEK